MRFKCIPPLFLQVSFRISVPGLGIIRYTVKRVFADAAKKSVLSVIEQFNSQAEISL